MARKIPRANRADASLRSGESSPVASPSVINRKETSEAERSRFPTMSPSLFSLSLDRVLKRC